MVIVILFAVMGWRNGPVYAAARVARFESVICAQISIGSNDLTQLVPGVEHDSEIVAFDFDERDVGVREIIRQTTVEGARRNGRHSGICGQAPSDYLEMAGYLVEIGIDSISLNPDTLLKTLRHVLEVEKRLGHNR